MSLVLLASEKLRSIRSAPGLSQPGVESAPLGVFKIDVEEHGRVRVSSGTDNHDDPIPVPAMVGQHGAQLSVILDRSSFAARNRAQPRIPGTPPPPLPDLTHFAFALLVSAPAGPRRAVLDQLPPQPGAGLHLPNRSLLRDPMLRWAAPPVRDPRREVEHLSDRARPVLPI